MRINFFNFFTFF